MSFFSRLLNYWVNQALVDTLANSKSFQRFAIRSSKWMEELQSKSSEHKEKLGSSASDIGSSASEFARHFREQLKKGMDDVYKTSGKK